ncbi:MAG TPA: hemerythrin domain-containing protein, partial [Nitrospira sp.]|nr:hemerythrin domain-containing protein [Nitrospira sp.]
LEEKILLPALQRLRGGTPFPLAAKLRLDHGALAALLMPTPRAPILAAIHAILSAHNELEEGPEGLYATCDQLAESEVGSLLERLRAAPDVTVTPPSDSAAVMKTVRGALERAGYRLSDDAAGEGS